MRLAAPKSWLCAAAVTLGLGAGALVAGHGVASAETASTPSPSATSSQVSAGQSGRATGAAAHPRRTTATPTSVATPATRSTVRTDVSALPATILQTPHRAILSAIRDPQAAVGRQALRAPAVPGARADVAGPVYSRHSPAGGVVTVQTPPTPADAVQTPYGDIGKWMLRSDNGIANWGGVKYRGKTLYEPINVIIVDPTSTTVLESTQRLNSAMVAAGFPALALHSTGFEGSNSGITYPQQPATALRAFSDAFFLLPNNHGRVFGPAPAPGGVGYVWTASFSRERIGFYRLLPRHVYVSFGRAREAVRAGLVCAGATDLGLVDLDNEYSTQTATTGDHDGYAAVIVLA